MAVLEMKFNIEVRPDMSPNLFLFLHFNLKFTVDKLRSDAIQNPFGYKMAVLGSLKLMIA